MLWTAAACVPLAALTAWADRRRSRQEGMARVGWVPWSGLTVALLFVGAGALILALQTPA